MTSTSCPRRAETGSTFNLPDTFTASDSYGDGIQRCSYCGSISQEAFLAAVRQGCMIGPTDKIYKLYVDVPTPNAGAPRLVTSSPEPRPGLIPWEDLDEQHRALVYTGSGAGHESRSYGFSTYGDTVQAKFYTAHLTDQALVDEFDQLMQDGRINWGHPGHLYRPLGLPVLPTRMQEQPS